MIATVVRVAEIDTLAPLPASLTRLAAVVGSADSSANDVAAVIELDQALTANTIRLANSAWSGSPKRIDTVREAVLRLGAGRILELAVGERVASALSRPCPGYELGEYELWRHSVAAALATEHLGRFAPRRVPGVTFTAALLHDIGKLLLARHLDRETVARIRETAASGGRTYLEAERSVLGTDHAEVGGAVARHWEFPPPIVAAIERHHDPDAEPDPVLDAVHIANAVAKLAGIGLGSEQMNMAASSQAAGRLGLSASGLESLCAAVLDELNRTEELWGIKAHGTERTHRG